MNVKTKKLNTIKLKDKDYATVPTRIKEFREQCPNGVIETSSKSTNDNEKEFIATIFKDGNNRNVGSATGHSFGALKEVKAFEKLETIAIGRALANLGFMASGEVASSEEMENFLSQKEIERLNKVQEIKDAVDKITDVAELRTFFSANKGYGVEVDSYIINKAKELKNGK